MIDSALRPLSRNLASNWTRSTLHIAAMIAVLSILATNAAAGDYVIVAATNAPNTLAPGTRLTGDTDVTLPDGAKATLVSRDGRMLTLEGARSGPIEGQPSDDPQAGPGLLPRLEQLLSNEASRSTVLGAARADAGDLPPPPAVWHMSADSSGPRCARPGTFVLWRRDATQEVTLTLRSADARHEGLVWQAGAQTIALPDDALLEDGRLIVSMDKTVRDFDVALRPDDVSSSIPGPLLAWLLEAGCKRQALTLISRVHAGVEIADD